MIVKAKNGALSKMVQFLDDFALNVFFTRTAQNFGQARVSFYWR